jgi:hypothetical protein
MDRSAFQAWLDRYVSAWRGYDPIAIGELFSEEAEYRYHPEDEPVRGRAAIVADWLGDQDAPGSWDARYEPLAIDGDVHISTGWTHYFDDAGQLRDAYSNLFVCRFDDRGRCTIFTEWYVQARRFARAAQQGAAA